MIAALFVDPRGCYAGLEGVELWDEARDARLYAGPHPVVAHPPCERWCMMAAAVEARYGYQRGDDGGAFEAALAAVRAFGGVLEHPAHSAAWAAYGLPRPNSLGGWQRAFCGGWVAHVEQGRYGHPARKATWLYVFGASLPDLLWGEAVGCTAWVGFAQNHNRGQERRRLRPHESSATPLAFRDALIAIARSARAEVAA